METKALVYHTWDDLVFENRNQQYGAYTLRKSYNDKMLIGLGISVAIAIFLLIVPGYLADKIFPDKIVKAKIIACTFDVRPMMFQKKKNEAKKPVQHVVSHNQNTTIQVTTNIVEEKPIQTETISTTTTTEGDVTDEDVSFTDDMGVATGQEVTAVEPVKEKIFDIVQQMPFYDGGMKAMIKFLERNLRYPNAPRRIGMEGTVYVSFVVNGDGSIRDVAVARGFHPDCDKEAVRVVSLLPGWVGGKQGGTPVPVRMVLPIKFTLS
jgi:protein TonB